jgi:hypothetical protein
MIARIWHGYTTHANAEAYAATLKAEILPGIMKVPGYNAVICFNDAAAKRSNSSL